MKIREGKFIVIEGPDGSGKTEQCNLLVERLKSEGYPIVTFDFPQYGKESSFFVRQYLNGAYGGWRDVGPYKASIFYAVDRFDISPMIRTARNSGNTIVSNRYVASNLGHQGAKLEGSAREEFFRWNSELEFSIFGIPRPDMNIILHMPVEIAFHLIEKKGTREYLNGKKKDVHEGDIEHLRAAEQSYLHIVKMWPEEYTLIECAENGKPLSIPEVHEKVWSAVKKIL